jgi:hypothetical protein
MLSGGESQNLGDRLPRWLGSLMSCGEHVLDVCHVLFLTSQVMRC